MFGVISAVCRRMSSNMQKNRAMLRNARKLKQQFKHFDKTKPTAEKVQKFIRTTKKDELTGKIARTANYDDEFRKFINEFNQKHKGKISLLDVSRYSKKFDDLSKPGLRPEDLKILEEFRKRRLQFKAMKQMKQDDSELSQLSSEEEMTEQQQQQLLDQNQSELTKQEINWQLHKTSGINQQENEEQDEEDDENEEDEVLDTTGESEKLFAQGPLQIDDEFMCLILDADSTTLVTTLQRINSFRCLVFMANSLGVIGYGRGKGQDPKKALSKAITQCQQNLIALPIDKNLSVPLPITQRFQDYELQIKPRSTFNPWGHPVVATMLSLSGLLHCAFKTVHGDSNNYGMLNSFMKSVTKNQTPKQLAEKKGFKIYRHQWVKPIGGWGHLKDIYRK